MCRGMLRPLVPDHAPISFLNTKHEHHDLKAQVQRGRGNFAPSQIRGGKFRCGKFCGAPWSSRQSPQCVLLVCEKFAENPEFRVGNFAVKLKREISHANLKCHEPPPPPPRA